MPPKFWQTQKFKALQTEWEEKLRETGFKDIEDEKRRLKQSAANAYRTSAVDVIQNKALYYELIGSRIHQEVFKDGVDRLVMERRANGVKIKDICFELKTLNERCHRDTVRLIIRYYEYKWGIKKQLGKTLLRFMRMRGVTCQKTT